MEKSCGTSNSDFKLRSEKKVIFVINTSYSPAVSDFAFPLQRQPEDFRLNEKGYFSSFIGEDFSRFNSEEVLSGNGSDSEICERLDKVGERIGVQL